MINQNFFRKKLAYCILLFTLTTSCTNTKQPEWINVYVHGTTFTVGQYLIDNVYTEFSYGKQGLNHINTLPSDCLFLKDAASLASGNSSKFDLNHFYSFAWSGKLSFYKREVDGKRLYQALKKLLQEYKQEYGYYPKLRIFTFSHGGNVVLNMVKHLPYFDDEHVYLELIIMACPVQKPTQDLLKNPKIDSIYTIASSNDYIQILDCYYFKKWFYFPNRYFCINQKNCKEINVLVNGYGITHTDMLRSIMPLIPNILHQADEWFETNDYNEVFNCNVKDPGFPFYNGFNILTAIYGIRYQALLQETSEKIS